MKEALPGDLGAMGGHVVVSYESTIVPRQKAVRLMYCREIRCTFDTFVQCIQYQYVVN